MPPQPLSLSDLDSLKQFRDAAAGLIKSLIRARIVEDRSYLVAGERRRWKVEDADRETRSCASLLTKVKQLNEQFQQRFAIGLDSISVPAAASDEERLEQLLDQVMHFIFGDIDEAIQRSTKNQPVMWLPLAHWHSLTGIRDALDKLPEDGTLETRQSQTKRVAIDVEKEIVYIDAVAFPLKGNEKHRRRLAELYDELIRKDGDYVSMGTFGVKTEYIEAQSSEVVELIERKRCIGARIPRDKLYN